MIPTIVSAKNYRCFSDQSPLKIDLRSGFTAFVGPNNSGKSSVLKLFYELRNIFSAHALPKSAPDGTVSEIQIRNPDPSSIFHDQNVRNIDIFLDVDDNAPITLASGARSIPVRKVEFSISRTAPNRVTVAFPDAPAAKLASHQGALKALGHISDAMYVGPFRNAVNEGTGSYYDLDLGTAFIQRWNAWKTGNNKLHNQVVLQVTERIRKIFSLDKLEINASQDQTTLQIAVNDRPYKLDEQGAGLAHFIIVLANAAIKRPKMLLIDEPELGLHPSLQVDFLMSVASYVDGPVLFATHSIGLARSLAERIYWISSDGEKSICRPLAATTPHYAEWLGELSYSSLQNLGFTKVLLVEGPSEVRTFQQLLRKIKKDHEVVLLPLGGSSLIRGDIDVELEEIKRICPKVFAFVDSERGSPTGTASIDRKDFVACCKRNGVEAALTDRRATENYFSDRAIKRALGQQFSALQPHDVLRSQSPAWSKSDNWKIALEMDWNELKDTDLGGFLELL